ncbi:hypothetical protein [Planococcus shixiaomingii]|uniref:hypothetical protein n=1 Tax=Planococcus shixiaomingii TaxID=3058393 RepID=UPI002657FB12|nr:hypothetical protein [Planococcus sp. N028]
MKKKDSIALPLLTGQFDLASKNIQSYLSYIFSMIKSLAFNLETLQVYSGCF